MEICFLTINPTEIQDTLWRVTHTRRTSRYKPGHYITLGGFIPTVLHAVNMDTVSYWVDLFHNVSKCGHCITVG